MPLGEYAFGIGPIGRDPTEIQDPHDDLQPIALEFDLAERDWKLLDNGQYAATHPVDQSVNLALGIRRGQLKGDPTLGNELHTVELGTSRTEEQVKVAVRNANPIKRLLADNEIREHGIYHEVQRNGRLMVEFAYVNQHFDPTRVVVRRTVV